MVLCEVVGVVVVPVGVAVLLDGLVRDAIDPVEVTVLVEEVAGELVGVGVGLVDVLNVDVVLAPDEAEKLMDREVELSVIVEFVTVEDKGRVLEAVVVGAGLTLSTGRELGEALDDVVAPPKPFADEILYCRLRLESDIAGIATHYIPTGARGSRRSRRTCTILTGRARSDADSDSRRARCLCHWRRHHLCHQVKHAKQRDGAPKMHYDDITKSAIAELEPREVR